MEKKKTEEKIERVFQVWCPKEFPQRFASFDLALCKALDWAREYKCKVVVHYEEITKKGDIIVSVRLALIRGARLRNYEEKVVRPRVAPKTARRK